MSAAVATDEAKVPLIPYLPAAVSAALFLPYSYMKEFIGQINSPLGIRLPTLGR
jgi:hypothetical protein